MRWLLRPVCWLWGHNDGRLLFAVYVGENAPKPPATFCRRCGKAPV